MKTPHLPLAARLFAAIVLTALAVVVVMALLVASSMRDGFAKYLVREEFVLLAPLAETLAQVHDADAPGWPQFRANPYAWREFLRAYGPQPPESGAPPAPPGGPGAPAPATAPIPGSGPQPAPAPAPASPVENRLILLDADGRAVVGGPIEGLTLETLPIMAPDAGPEAAPLGWLALATHGAIQSETDAYFLRSQLTSLVYAALVAVALSALGAALLARQVLVPIRALERGARRLAQGEYSARIPGGRGDELGRLIAHYNALAESLEAAERAQSQWVSDTSHELQTPLAVLRANIEAIEDGVRPADARTLGAMSEAVARLTRLVADLRLLSAWREDGLVADRRPADLAEIARAALDAAAGGFADAGLTLRHEIAGPVALDCDAGRIRQVIDNLLENSLRYTDAPGEVRVAVRAVGAAAHLVVDDTAPAPPAASMPRLFDRFHRAEASRSRSFGGSGLGLAICKAIVEAHGGTISAAASPLGGLSVQVTLPAGRATRDAVRERQ